MIRNDGQYRYLVVGGTGMFAPFCQALELQEVIIAARFLSHRDQLEALQKKIYVCAVGLLLCSFASTIFRSCDAMAWAKILHIVDSFARPYVFLC